MTIVTASQALDGWIIDGADRLRCSEQLIANLFDRDSPAVPAHRGEPVISYTL